MKWHPLPAYRAANVPVALSTDDEGVSRITLTTEYTRAALDYKLSYLDLKRMARTSLEHSFLPGPSLWQQTDAFTENWPLIVVAMAGVVVGTLAGERVLRRIPEPVFRRTEAAPIWALGVVMFSEASR